MGRHFFVSTAISLLQLLVVQDNIGDAIAWSTNVLPSMTRVPSSARRAVLSAKTGSNDDVADNTAFPSSRRSFFQTSSAIAAASIFSCITGNARPSFAEDSNDLIDVYFGCGAS